MTFFQDSDVGYTFFENMQLFDARDRTEIQYGLRRVFENDVSRINSAIAAQVSEISTVD